MSIALFIVIAILMAIDLGIEFVRGEPMALQTFELMIFVASLAGIAGNWWRMLSERRRAQHLDRELVAARDEATRWSEDAKRWNGEAQQLLKGLGEAIDRQFERWELTPAEREVALLQLKGLRHRDIAQLRETSERTVRQQALAVYRKAGLNGRSDLAAFFLEDLLLPRNTSSDVRASGT